MNPFCPNCKVATRVRWGKTDAGHNNLGVQKVGRSKFFICSKCGRRWQVGAEAILQKRDPKEIRAEIKAEKEARKQKESEGMK